MQRILAKVHEAGDIYFGEYGGNYCTGCERFYAERELVDGKCPDHHTEPVWIKEENYFFRMSKYQDALARHLEAHPDMIRPAGYRNEVHLEKSDVHIEGLHPGMKPIPSRRPTCAGSVRRLS